jgi:hypothetical protein
MHLLLQHLKPLGCGLSILAKVAVHTHAHGIPLHFHVSFNCGRIVLKCDLCQRFIVAIARVNIYHLP